MAGLGAWRALGGGSLLAVGWVSCEARGGGGGEEGRERKGGEGEGWGGREGQKTSLTTVSRFPLFRGVGDGVLSLLGFGAFVGLDVECRVSRCLRTS